MGELKFILGLQIKQTPKGIYIRQTKYVKELLKKINIRDAKRNEDPNAHHHIPWTRRGINKGGQDSVVHNSISLRLGLISCSMFVYVQYFKKNQGKFT